MSWSHHRAEVEIELFELQAQKIWGVSLKSQKAVEENQHCQAGEQKPAVGSAAATPLGLATWVGQAWDCDNL